MKTVALTPEHVDTALTRRRRIVPPSISFTVRGRVYASRLLQQTTLESPLPLPSTRNLPAHPPSHHPFPSSTSPSAAAPCPSIDTQEKPRRGLNLKVKKRKLSPCRKFVWTFVLSRSLPSAFVHFLLLLLSRKTRQGGIPKSLPPSKTDTNTRNPRRNTCTFFFFFLSWTPRRH